MPRIGTLSTCSYNNMTSSVKCKKVGCEWVGRKGTLQFHEQRAHKKCSKQ